MKTIYALLLLFLAAVVLSASPERPLAIVGGTVLDVSSLGTSSHDLADATVLIRGDLAQPAAVASSVESVAPVSQPPMHESEAAPAVEWHVSRDGDTSGPLDTVELRAWLSS